MCTCVCVLSIFPVCVAGFLRRGWLGWLSFFSSFGFLSMAKALRAQNPYFHFFPTDVNGEAFSPLLGHYGALCGLVRIHFGVITDQLEEDSLVFLFGGLRGGGGVRRPLRQWVPWGGLVGVPWRLAPSRVVDPLMRRTGAWTPLRRRRVRHRGCGPLGVRLLKGEGRGSPVVRDGLLGCPRRPSLEVFGLCGLHGAVLGHVGRVMGAPTGTTKGRAAGCFGHWGEWGGGVSDRALPLFLHGCHDRRSHFYICLFTSLRVPTSALPYLYIHPYFTCVGATIGAPLPYLTFTRRLSPENRRRFTVKTKASPYPNCMV